MIGRTPSTINAGRILQHGTPESVKQSAIFFRNSLRPYCGLLNLAPRVVVTVASKNEPDRRAVRDTMYCAGSRDVLLLEAGMAAAIGAGWNVQEPEFRASLVFERDWFQYSVISLAGVVTGAQEATGFENLLEDIAIYLTETQQFCPAPDVLLNQVRQSGFRQTAEGVLGWDAWVADVSQGRARLENVDAESMVRGVTPALRRLALKIQQAHQRLDREKQLLAEAAPLHMFGEYGEIPGLAALLEQTLNRKVVVGPEPRQAMIRGALSVLKNLDWWLSNI